MVSKSAAIKQKMSVCKGSAGAILPDSYREEKKSQRSTNTFIVFSSVFERSLLTATVSLTTLLREIWWCEGVVREASVSCLKMCPGSISLKKKDRDMVVGTFG